LVFFFLPGMIFGLKCYGCKKIWYNDALYYSSQLDCSIIRDCDEGITSCISGTLEQIPGMNEYDMYHVKGCAGSANSWNIEETCEKTVASSKSYDVKLETCTIEKCGEDLCNTQATDDIFSWRDDWEKNRPAVEDEDEDDDEDKDCAATFSCKYSQATFHADSAALLVGLLTVIFF